MFIDEAVVTVRSGKGGDGVVHFRREKYIPRGGPDGGDGGRGGDVVIQVSTKLNTLYEFQHQHLFIAKDGERGAKSNRTGRSAEDLIIHVPAGTIVYDPTNMQMIADLLGENQEFTICKGGRGGKGNSRFANSRDQAPRVAEKGAPGEERVIRLELKLIADVGIIGVPNAGKSTLLSATTNARPKIGDYPFTTLEPNLGVANFDEDTSIVMADIPGLIEGAHSGTGLGFDFLRHIQRTRVLIHLLDGLSDDQLLDFGQINSELALFDPDLARKPQIVALSKMDLPEAQERQPGITKKFKKIGIPVVPISAATGLNLHQLLGKVVTSLQETPIPLTQPSTPIYQAHEDPRNYEIKRENEGWRIIGASIERAAAMTYWNTDASMRRFQRILEALGIDDDLRKRGVKTGDTVFIGEHELEWAD